MNKERLLYLAGFLETSTAPQERFDFTEWCNYIDGRGDEDGSRPQNILDDCGTTGCAIGYACSIPDFIKQGLRLSFSGAPIFEDKDGTCWHHFEAAEKFFDLDSIDTKFLFDPHSNHLGNEATAQEVAQHIRKFVAANEHLRRT